MRIYWALAAFTKRHSGFIWGFTIAWLISHWRDLVILWGEVSNWYPIVVLFIICEVMFNAGLLIMAAATGSQVFSGTGLRPRRWLKALGAARREFGKTVDDVQNRKAFRWGLYLNWFGAAMGTGFLPLILIPLLLPVTSWPLMITPMVDLLLTFASRMTIQQRTNRTKLPDHRGNKQESAVTTPIIRPAQPSDLDAYVEIQRRAWGEMAASTDQVRSRFEVHTEGILLAEVDGEIVGSATLIRLAEYEPSRPLSWNEATGKGSCTTHVSEGPVVFLVDLSSTGAVRAAPALLGAAVEFVSTVGAKNLTWGARMPGFAKYRNEHPDVSADDYLQEKTPEGRYLDWQVRMYSEAIPGVEVVRVVPDYFEDPDSLDHGVMMRVSNPAHIAE